MKTKEETYKRLEELLKAGTQEQAARELNNGGYKTVRGKKWTKGNISAWVFNRKGHRQPARKANGKAASPRKRSAHVVTISAGQLSANKKLSLIKQIVLGLHQ